MMMRMGERTNMRENACECGECLNELIQKKINYLILCVCVCPGTCRHIAHDEWLIMKLCMYMYVRYNTANNVSNVGGDPMTQLSFKSYNA